MQLGLVVIAAVLTALSGAYMRYDLMTPEVSGRALFAFSLSSHVLWSCFALCVPLPFLIVNALVSGQLAESARRNQALETKTISRASAKMHQGALVLNLLAVVAFLLAGVPAVQRAVAPLGIPLLMLAVLTYAASTFAAMASMWTSRLALPLVTLCLTTGATLLFGLPCALEALDRFVDVVSPAQEGYLFGSTMPVIFESVGTLRKTGIYVITGPAIIFLAWRLVTTRRSEASLSQRLVRQLRVGLGLGLVVVVLAAAVVAILAAQGSLPPHFPDSYWLVGWTHTTLGGPVFGLLLWLAIPRYLARRTARWLLPTTGFLFIAACGAEMLLGTQGMPTGYMEYPPELAWNHRLVGLTWFAFIAAFAAVCGVLRRDRRDIPSSEVFS